jgi:hypothetical protein
MALKDTTKHLKDLLNSIVHDLEKADGGNKAASQRVRTGTVKLEKIAKLYRKESIKSEKTTKGTKRPAAKKAAKKSAAKPKVTKVKAKPKAKSHTAHKAQLIRHIRPRPTKPTKQLQNPVHCLSKSLQRNCQSKGLLSDSSWLFAADRISREATCDLPFLTDSSTLLWRITLSN